MINSKSNDYDKATQFINYKIQIILMMIYV